MSLHFKSVCVGREFDFKTLMGEKNPKRACRFDIESKVLLKTILPQHPKVL